jgi:hypothetical protein
MKFPMTPKGINISMSLKIRFISTDFFGSSGFEIESPEALIANLLITGPGAIPLIHRGYPAGFDLGTGFITCSRDSR